MTVTRNFIEIEARCRSATHAIPVTATKGQRGHALGAAGAWEAALSNSSGFGGINAALLFRAVESR
jgi:3-oxoacyl-(acyl-carrier-protein) synthase